MNLQFYEILNAFIREKGLISYQLNSYNTFVTERLKKIIKDIGTIKPVVPELGKVKIKFGNVKWGGPYVKEADGSVRTILPFEAKLRNLSYISPLYVEMKVILNGVENKPEWVTFGDLPVMVKSIVCPLSRMSREELIKCYEDPDDPGGYFIINGTERVLVLVEEISENRIIVEKVDKGNIKEIARIHSKKSGYIQRHLIERLRDGTIYITFANIVRFPIIALLKALGLEKDRDIVLAVSLDERVQDELYVNLIESEVKDQKEAIELLAKYTKIMRKSEAMEAAEKLLDKYLLPHLGQERKHRMDKALLLAKAIEKIIKVHLGIAETDDLDHYSNKRLRLAGELLEILFRSVLLGRYGLVPRITFNYQKLAKRGKLPPLQAIVEANTFTNQILSTLAIGTWVGGRTGVCQRLDRMSYMKSLSQMRNVLSPLSSTQEHFEARELHPTHFGKLCTSETPEGTTIGLRKYLALTAEVTEDIEDKESVIKNLPPFKPWHQ